MPYPSAFFPARAASAARSWAVAGLRVAGWGVLGSLALGVAAMSVAAQSPARAPADTAAVADTDAERRLLPPTFGINGLVVDETRTVMGRDFYDVFFDAWVAPEGAVNFTVVVEEQPIPGRGTRVTVRVNDRPAYESRLQPGYERIRESALAAVGYARRALAAAAPLSRGL